KSDSTDPKCLEHPSLGRRVDIAALDVTEAIDGLQIDHVNRLENDAILDPFASQDVFVVGFPFGMIANAPAPIWKRGSIALDPTFDPEGLPKMLIDTATREECLARWSSQDTLLSVANTPKRTALNLRPSYTPDSTW